MPRALTEREIAVLESDPERELYAIDRASGRMVKVGSADAVGVWLGRFEWIFPPVDDATSRTLAHEKAG